MVCQKLYEKASHCVLDQANEQRADAGDIDERLTADRETLVVTTQAPCAT